MISLLRNKSLAHLFRMAALIFGVSILLCVSFSFAQDRRSTSSSAPEKDFWSSYEGKDSGGQAKGEMGGDLGVSTLRMIGSTALVLGLIVLIAYLVRRYAPRTTGQGRSDVFHIIGTKMLGGRKTLMLVRVRGQTLLLGITPQSIQCLTEIHEVEGEWAQPPDASGEGSGGAFDRQLGKFLSSSHPEKKPL